MTVVTVLLNVYLIKSSVRLNHNDDNLTGLSKTVLKFLSYEIIRGFTVHSSTRRGVSEFMKTARLHLLIIKLRTALFNSFISEKTALTSYIMSRPYTD